MDYETFIAKIDDTTAALSSSVAEWHQLDSVAGVAFKAACEREIIDVQALQDIRASMSSEQNFFRQLQSRVNDYREQLAGFKKFYTVTAPVPQMAVTVEEPAKTGLFGRLKKQAPPAASAIPLLDETPSVTTHNEQRAFIEMKNRIVQLDALLADVKEYVSSVSEGSEELAFGFKTEVVKINSVLRSKPTEAAAKKLETRRFYLEEAIGIASDRVVFLGLQARVVAKMHSTEVVENPFEDFAIPSRSGTSARM